MNDDKKNGKYRPSDSENDDIYEYIYEEDEKPPQKGGYKRTTPPHRKKAYKDKKPHFAIFYVVALFIAIIFCIMVFAFVFNSVSNDNDNPNDPKTTNSTDLKTPTPSTAVVNESKEIIGIITKFDKSDSEIEIIDVNTGDAYELKVDGQTELKDKHGQNIIFAELNIGDVISGKFDTNTMILSSASQSSDAWEKKLVDEVEIKPESKIINVEGQNYSYNDKIVVHYKNQPMDIIEIEPIDIVTLKGYKDNVWYIEVNKSHGELLISNVKDIKNGTIEVDTSEFMDLKGNESLTLVEGPHKIVIKGDNIEPYTKEVEIVPREKINLDLSQVQYKSSVLEIKTNVESPVITIDGKTYPPDEPIILSFGEYTINITKEGYLPWSETVNLKDPSTEVVAELTKSISMCELTISTNVEGAEIYIDNGKIGESLVTELVPYGKHTITAKKPGYKDTTIEMDLAKEKDGFQINMQPLESKATTTPSS